MKSGPELLELISLKLDQIHYKEDYVSDKTYTYYNTPLYLELSHGILNLNLDETLEVQDDILNFIHRKTKKL